LAHVIFFWKNQEEPEAPTVNALKGTQSAVTKQGKEEEERRGVKGQQRREKRPKNYKLELIHDFRRGLILALHLCMSRSASTVKYLLQSCTVGFLFLKITSFLIIQITQQRRMKMSRENSTFTRDFEA